MSEANAVQLGTDELAAMVPALRAEVEALKAGLPADKADALSALEAKVEQIGAALDALAESFSQLDARLTGRVNDTETRVTQQANYLTEFAGKTSDRLHRLEVATFTGNTPREPGAAVVGGEPSSLPVGKLTTSDGTVIDAGNVPVVGTLNSETGTVRPTGDGPQ